MPYQRYLYTDVPVPRRTLYRRRREAKLAQIQQQYSESSDTDDQDSANPIQLMPRREEGFSSDDSFKTVHSDHVANELGDSDAINDVDTLERAIPSKEIETSTEDNRSFQGSGDESDEHGVTTENEACKAPTNSSTSESAEESEENQASNGFISNIENLVAGNDIIGEVAQPAAQQVLLNTALCPCSATTEGDALLMCLALGMRHNLSWVALVDILDFINKLYGRQVVHSSKYFLFKFFDKLKEKDVAVVHVYCPQCENYLGPRNLLTEEKIQVCQCGQEVQLKGQSASYFVSVNLKSQFKSLMEIPEVAQEIMTYRFQRVKHSQHGIEDIFDGQEYKKHFDTDGPLSDGKNFSVTINTDGMDLGTSASRSAWPIFMYINELSPNNRKKHVIFAGIWVGETQPNMNVFLTPFANEMRSLCSEGFTWCNSNGEEVTSLVLPLIGVFDSGARYKLLNLSGHSAYYGCTFCYQKAENLRGPNGSYNRRFTIEQNAAPLRTHQSMMQDMQTVHTNRNHPNKKHRVYKGCKGFTPLVLLHPYFDLGKGVIVDFMHNALLGVTRSHAAHLLQNSGKQYYVGDPEHTNTIDARLRMIRPPTSITRTPREVKYAKKWKAAEWRMFLIFYGLLCYDRILHRKYFVHFAMLSSAFYILLKKSISLHDLELSHQYLRQFVYLQEQYFGKMSMVYNVHLLLHVTQGVRDWGPLWGPNTFIFEGENRHLGQMNTSSGQVALQLTRRYLTVASYPHFVDRYASSQIPLEFIKKITGRNYQNFVQCDNCILIGKGVSGDLTAEELQCLADANLLEVENVQNFERCLYSKIRYTSRAYAEGKKNDDSWVKITSGIRGSIEKILLIQIPDNKMVTIFILQEVLVDREPILRDQLVNVTHIKRVQGRGSRFAVSPKHITNQCIYFNLDTGNFIADIPFGCYGD